VPVGWVIVVPKKRVCTHLPDEVVIKLNKIRFEMSPESPPPLSRIIEMAVLEWLKRKESGEGKHPGTEVQKQRVTKEQKHTVAETQKVSVTEEQRPKVTEELSSTGTEALSASDTLCSELINKVLSHTESKTVHIRELRKIIEDNVPNLPVNDVIEILMDCGAIEIEGSYVRILSGK